MIDETQDKSIDNKGNFHISSDNEFTPKKMTIVSNCEGAEDAIP